MKKEAENIAKQYKALTGIDVSPFNMPNPAALMKEINTLKARRNITPRLIQALHLNPRDIKVQKWMLKSKNENLKRAAEYAKWVQQQDHAPKRK